MITSVSVGPAIVQGRYYALPRCPRVALLMPYSSAIMCCTRVALLVPYSGAIICCLVALLVPYIGAIICWTRVALLVPYSNAIICCLVALLMPYSSVIICNTRVALLVPYSNAIIIKLYWAMHIKLFSNCRMRLNSLVHFYVGFERWVNITNVLFLSHSNNLIIYILYNNVAL